MSDEVEIKLIRLPVEEYKHLNSVEDGVSLLEKFPKQVYGLMCGDQVLEVAPELTERMKEMGFKDE